MDSLSQTSQMDLIPTDQLSDAQEVVSLEAYGQFTGERLFSQKPAKYRLVMSLLAEGTLSMRQIADAVKVSRNTVSAIARREAVAIEPLKKELSARYRHIARLCAERIEELLLSGSSLGLRDMGIMAGIAVEKSELLAGGATHRVAVDAPSPTAEDWHAELDRWRRAREIDGEVEIGLGGETPRQIGGELAAGAGGLAAGCGGRVAGCAGCAGAAAGGVQGGGEDCGERRAQAGQAGAIGEADGLGDVGGAEAVVGHPGASVSDMASGDVDAKTADTQGGAG